MDKPMALISVWDKEGLPELARALADAGYALLSSSGTAAFLRDCGFEVVEVLDLTGVPSILGGRVKTLHPRVMGGILARRGNAGDDAERVEHGIPLVDVVACTLYPFEETARAGAEPDELIEKIDIGGVSLLRAAAKNHASVAVIGDAADYPRVIEALRREGSVPSEMRRELAVKAFSITSAYDGLIAEGLASALGVGRGESDRTTIVLTRSQRLRYGENPYQSASLYARGLEEPSFVQHSGKELSYNNLLDFDALLRGCEIFGDSCACVIVKHSTPCGVGAGRDAAEAYEKALECDRVSAFGGIVGFTRELDMAAAEKLSAHFFEVVAAPSFADGVAEMLGSKKPNLRLLTASARHAVCRRIMIGNRSGVLVQDDALPPIPREDEGRWVGVRRADLWDDMIFAYKTAYLAKSNAIAIARDGAAIGIGGGFTNRVDAVRYALAGTGDAAKGAVLASDAFFPFPDSVELAAEAGIAAIIQPGGSVKDDEVARRAEELGVSMFMGCHRAFRH